MKPMAMLEVSAIHPMKAGHMAPPATIITSSEDPFLVNPPRFFMRKNGGEHNRHAEIAYINGNNGCPAQSRNYKYHGNNIDGCIQGEHAMRVEPFHVHAAQKPARHEKDEAQ